MPEIATTAGIATSITLSAMSASLSMSFTESADARTIMKLAGKHCSKSYGGRSWHHVIYQQKTTPRVKVSAYIFFSSSSPLTSC